MLNQKKLEIFLVKIRKSLAKQFLEVAYKKHENRKYYAPPLFINNQKIIAIIINISVKVVANARGLLLVIIKH